MTNVSEPRVINGISVLLVSQTRTVNCSYELMVWRSLVTIMKILHPRWAYTQMQEIEPWV
jgi:hypothetical protein